MKTTLLFLLLSVATMGYSQENFRIKYNCYKVFVPTGGKDATGENNGKWSETKKTLAFVDFGVGKSQNIVITDKGVKSVYVVDEKPMEGKLPSGMGYQLILGKKAGKIYAIQFLENINVRVIWTDGSNRMIEYGCSE